MKRFLKILFSVGITLYFSSVLFYCMVAGAVPGTSDTVPYVLKAAFLALLFPTFSCGTVHYILYLRKKLNEKENNTIR